MEKVYVSFSPDWAYFRKKLPWGPRWPKTWLAGLASLTALIRGPALPALGEETRASFMWLMSPWPAAEGLRLDSAWLRHTILKGLARRQIGAAVLSGPLLKAGGGLDAWRNNAKTPGYMGDGSEWDVLGAVLCLLNEPPCRVMLAGSGDRMAEAAALLALHAKCLTVCAPHPDRMALEWLRDRLMYESGTVIQLTQQPMVRDYKQTDLLLVTDSAPALEHGLPAMSPGSLLWDLTADGRLFSLARIHHPHLKARHRVFVQWAPHVLRPAGMLGCVLPDFENLRAGMEAVKPLSLIFSSVGGDQLY
jgi:hypothetical protein